MKKPLFPLIFLLLIPFMLNFVPIKYAIKLNEAQLRLEPGVFICATESKFTEDSGWRAAAELNPGSNQDIAVMVSGSSPDQYLSSREFDFIWFEVENRFVLKGEVERTETNPDTYISYTDLNVQDWQIIYPVKRSSIRQYFTPVSYLNIYDYDWRKVWQTFWS